MGVGNVLSKLGQFGLGGLMSGDSPLMGIAGASPLGGIGLLQRMQGGQHQQVEPDRVPFMPRIPDYSMSMAPQSFADAQMPAGAIEALAQLQAGRGGPAYGQSVLARMPGLMRPRYSQRY